MLNFCTTEGGQTQKSPLVAGLVVAVMAWSVQTSAMNQTKAMLKVIEMARIGCALPVDEAMSLIAAMLDGLDVHSDTYERDVDDLMRIGATIWTLAGRD